MKTIEEILNNYSEYETFMDDRFGRRLCDFLTTQQMKQIGFVCIDEEKMSSSRPKEWTEENILQQLKADVQFGWQKAQNERGISSSFMYEVVKAWCKVLENEFADFDDYAPYGKPLFRAVANKYGFELEE